MCGHKLVAELIWVLVQTRSHILAETLCRKCCSQAWIERNAFKTCDIWFLACQYIVWLKSAPVRACTLLILTSQQCINKVFLSVVSYHALMPVNFTHGARAYLLNWNWPPTQVILQSCLGSITPFPAIPYLLSAPHCRQNSTRMAEVYRNWQVHYHLGTSQFLGSIKSSRSCLSPWRVRSAGGG